MRIENSLYKCASLLVLSMFILTGCAPTRISVRVNEHERYGSMVYQRTFDEDGRPVFLMFSDRPTGVGEKFSLVEFEGNRPSVSYEIEVVDEPDKDVLKPVSNFFKNLALSLGLGLVLGLIFYDEAFEDDNDSEWPDSMEPDTAFSAGFAIGAGAGLLYTGYGLVNDTSRLIVNKLEKVESETYYSYDEMGRLESMTTMPPVGNQWKSKRTEFIYHGDETDPSETNTTGDRDATQAGETH